MSYLCPFCKTGYTLPNIPACPECYDDYMEVDNEYRGMCLHVPPESASIRCRVCLAHVDKAGSYSMMNGTYFYYNCYVAGRMREKRSRARSPERQEDVGTKRQKTVSPMEE